MNRRIQNSGPTDLHNAQIRGPRSCQEGTGGEVALQRALRAPRPVELGWETLCQADREPEDL